MAPGTDFLNIQSAPEGKISILGAHSIGYSKQKKSYTYVRVCLIPNGLRY
jgi:hypothetical protein